MEELDDPLVKVLLAAALVDALINLTSDSSVADGLLTVRTAESRRKSTWNKLPQDPKHVLSHTSLNPQALATLQDLLEPAVILLILAANATVGLWQRGNADAALQALKDCQCPTARVLRRAEGAESSQFVTVPTAQLVPGDVITVRVRAGPAVLHSNTGTHRHTNTLSLSHTFCHTRVRLNR